MNSVMSEKSSSLILLSLGCVLGVSLIVFFGSGQGLKAPPSAFLTPPKDLQHFTFGYNESLADSLWLRLIQDIDHCEEAKKMDENWGAELCSVEKGWVFHMLDSITTITPRFRAPYSYGAITLSVVVNDKKGASQIFERALEQFPNDWPIQFRAAYHYLFEIRDFQRAAELFTLAGKNGAPPWVFLLASKLYTKAGQVEVAKAVISQLIEQDPESRLAERFRLRLSQIEKGVVDLEMPGADTKVGEETN
jgi:tetratricopeptide (TPR) repeat protein